MFSQCPAAVLQVSSGRRLRLLEQCYDPATIRRLRALGVSSGWRCLEVGAGGGSVAAFLCRETAAQGHVVAIDIDTRFVREIDAGNLEVIEADIKIDPGAVLDRLLAFRRRPKSFGSPSPRVGLPASPAEPRAR